MPLVDAGIDDANGLAGAGLNVFALGEGETRVRLVGVDCSEAPLRREVAPGPIVFGERGRPFLELLDRKASLLVGVDAGGLDGYSPGGSTGYSLSWLRQSTAFPCRAMVVAVSGL